jgi:hypothetical protein
VSLEQDLRTFLLAQSAVTAVVRDRRIYCGPRDASDPLPAITISRMSGDHGHTLTAASGWCKARVQVNSFATNYVDADALGEIIRNELDMLTGTIGTSSTNVSAVVLESDFPAYDTPTDSSQIGVHRWVSEYMILYAISIPSVTT